jgi:predicted nucleotidyltransferase
MLRQLRSFAVLCCNSLLLKRKTSKLKAKQHLFKVFNPRVSMKTIDEIKTLLEELKPILRQKYQVETIGVFGSYSRKEQKSKSDIDILVTFVEPNDIDLIDFIEIKQFLSRKLKMKVDLVRENSLKPIIRDKILEETIYI